MHAFLQRCSFALANTAGILLALYVALAADLERPYWAVFSAFIVAAPLAGAVRSKAVWRLVGTVLGASAALVLIPPLVHSPPLLCAALAVWIALCLGLSLLDRTPRSYALMLSGYTAAIVGLGVVDAPDSIFDNAVARVEEIGVGILCASLAHSIFFPRTVAVELNDKINAALRFFASSIAQTLREPADEAKHLAASKRLTELLADLHTLRAHLSFELSDVPRVGRHLIVLQRRLSALLPTLMSAQLAIERLRADGSLSTPVSEAIATSAAWADRLAHASDVFEVATPPSLDALHSVPAAAASAADWSQLLEQTVTSQICDLIAGLEACRALARAIRAGDSDLPAHLVTELDRAKGPSLYRDYTLAALSSCAAATAIIVGCVLWIGGSWPEGGIAAQFAAIGCSFFAAFDRPSKPLSMLLCGVLLILPVSAFYQFALLPQVAGFVRLALAITPILLLLSFLQALPKFAGVALIMGITFSGALAFQQMYHPDFAAFVNITLAQIAGVLLAIAINLVMRTIDPTWNAARLLRAAWQAMRRLTRNTADTVHAHSHLVDCLGQVAAREALVDASAREQIRSDVLRDLRVGAHLVALNRTERVCEPAFAAPLRDVRESIASMYEAPTNARALNEPLAKSLDAGITSLAALPCSECRIKALASLVALRLDLIPEAMPARALEAIA